MNLQNELRGEVISLTFGDQGENHIGMEKVGTMVNKGEGFNRVDLENYMKIFEENDYKTELHNLNDLLDENIEEKAYVLVIRNGINYFLQNNDKTIKEIQKEMKSFEWDKKYYDTRRKKVLNKNARANVCFGEKSIEPNYEEKIGRVVSYNDLPTLKIIKNELENKLGNKMKNLICEGNRYFDLKQCGIGWHGDGERRKVVAFRLGEKMNLHYNWFYKNKSVGNTLKIKLNNGDMYIMSEKAVGTDWKRSSIYTLRHSAGLENSKYLKLNK